MSDIYVELKSRIPVVASRTRIGRERLEEAQAATGLSNERLARQIPVSEKTWRRWKQAGEVPTHALPSLARVLQLELTRPGRDAPVQDVDGLQGSLRVGVAEILDGQDEILVRLARLEAKLDALESRPQGRRTGRA